MTKKNVIAIIIIAVLFVVVSYITISIMKKPYLGLFACAIIPVLFIPLLKTDKKNKNTTK